MPRKKELSDPRLDPVVVKARAGLIPASEDIEDELNARTALIGRTVRAYAKLNGGRDDLAIADILDDLRHYCDSNALSFGELDAGACESYLELVKESPWITRAKAS